MPFLMIYFSKTAGNNYFFLGLSISSNWPPRLFMAVILWHITFFPLIIHGLLYPLPTATLFVISMLTAYLQGDACLVQQIIWLLLFPSQTWSDKLYNFVVDDPLQFIQFVYCTAFNSFSILLFLLKLIINRKAILSSKLLRQWPAQQVDLKHRAFCWGDCPQL